MQAAVVEQLRSAAATLAGLDFHDLPDAAVLEMSEEILRAQRRLDGALNAALQVIETRDVTTTERGYTTRAWLVEEHQLAPGDAARRLRVARSAPFRPAVADALRAGDATIDQAAVIVAFLPKLPAPEDRELACKELLDACRYADPTMLAKGLRELTDRLCLNESDEARAVRRREGRYLTFTDTIDRMVHLDGMLTAADASIVKKALYPLGLKLSADDERTARQRDADALVELASIAMKAGTLPETGGEPTQCLVGTSLADLLRALLPGDSATSTLNGVPITPNTARRLPPRQPNDRQRRPTDRRFRRRMGHCGATLRSAPEHTVSQPPTARPVAPQCASRRPLLHHDRHWSQGGRTDHSNATSP